MSDSGERGGWLWGRFSGLALAVAGLTFLIDQAHKYWMIYVYDIISKGPVQVSPYLDLVFVKNIGISYSMFNQGSMTGQYMLAAFAVLVSAGLWVWIARSGETKLMAGSLALIIGGALGNAVDRVLLGGVADFFLIHFVPGDRRFDWYVFNIADVAIVAGVIGLLYDSYKSSRNDAAKPL